MHVLLHHVQLAMPVGGENKARSFYGDLLGIAETPKPRSMQANGGCWFEQNLTRIHLGVEEGFIPAKKAHPALQVSEFNALRLNLENAGYETQSSNPIDGFSRFFVDDPFGNRVEIIDMEKIV